MKKPNPHQFNIDVAAENAMKLISGAAEAAAKTLANAAAEAVKVVAATAAESAKTVEFRRTEDHDLLIRLEEKMGGLKADIQELKEGHAGKIENHEVRLKAICEWRARIDGPDGCLEKIPKYESRILGLENSRLEFKTQIKTWIIIGGCIISAIIFIIDKVLPALR